MMRTLQVSIASAFFVLGAAGCATGDAPDDEPPAEETAADREASEPPTDEDFSDEERSALEEKFCRAALEHKEEATGESVPEECERVVMRRSEQLDEGDKEGYLVTVVVGQRREKIELGGTVDSDGEVELETLESNLERAAVEDARVELGNLENAIDTYYLESDPQRLPESLDDLTEEPLELIDEVPEDPWGNEYIYEPEEEGKDFELFSAGPDGKAGTVDDIRSR
ncbi:MAG: type II secretion system protein GspG [Persicimonas sp.]